MILSSQYGTGGSETHEPIKFDRRDVPIGNYNIYCTVACARPETFPLPQYYDNIAELDIDCSQGLDDIERRGLLQILSGKALNKIYINDLSNTHIHILNMINPEIRRLSIYIDTITHDDLRILQRFKNLEHLALTVLHNECNEEHHIHSSVFPASLRSLYILITQCRGTLDISSSEIEQLHLGRLIEVAGDLPLTLKDLSDDTLSFTTAAKLHNLTQLVSFSHPNLPFPEHLLPDWIYSLPTVRGLNGFPHRRICPDDGMSYGLYEIDAHRGMQFPVQDGDIYRDKGRLIYTAGINQHLQRIKYSTNKDDLTLLIDANKSTLEQLSLRCCLDYDYSALTNLTTLKIMHGYATPGVDLGRDIITQLRSLSTLRLTYLSIFGAYCSDWSVLYDLIHLTNLVISFNKQQNERFDITSQITKLCNLESLTLIHTYGELHENIGYLTSLKSLDIMTATHNPPLVFPRTLCRLVHQLTYIRIPNAILVFAPKCVIPEDLIPLFAYSRILDVAHLGYTREEISDLIIYGPCALGRCSCPDHVLQRMRNMHGTYLSIFPADIIRSIAPYLQKYYGRRGIYDNCICTMPFDEMTPSDIAEIKLKRGVHLVELGSPNHVECDIDGELMLPSNVCRACNSRNSRGGASHLL